MNCSTEKQKSRSTVIWVCLALAALVWGVFGQTLRFGFVNYDDDRYVYENTHVSNGITVQGLQWALSHPHVNNWHPLTSLSHMLDVEFFGLDAGGHHGTNVLLHTLTVLALFLVLRSMTGSLWGSAFAAAVFAVHPLRAESVAWISERKDVLSGLFFMLTLGAYTRYARETDAGSRKHGTGRLLGPLASGRYWLVLLFLALGLMSKPMLVTVPFVLLLLDFWPLNRFETAGIKSLLLEKTPMLLLVACCCIVTMWAQDEAMLPSGQLSLFSRIENAIVSYAVYIRQLFWPSGLAVLYPLAKANLPLWRVVASLGLLSVISVIAICQWKKRPWLLVGWLWYLGMLVPVIGIMQVGFQAHADRYTYLPHIGLLIALSWLITDLSSSRRHRNWLLGAAGVTVVAALATGAWVQTTYWRDSESLWRHTLAHTTGNLSAHNNLGGALAGQGKTAEAIEHFRIAERIDPDDVKVHVNLGSALTSQGKIDEAIEHFRIALRINPDLAEGHNNLGIALAGQGKTAEAIEHFRMAVQINPDRAEGHNNLGIALAGQGMTDEAIGQFRMALQVNPAYAEAHNNLGIALAGQGKIGEAIEHFRSAVQFNPDNLPARNNLNQALMIQGERGRDD